MGALNFWLDAVIVIVALLFGVTGFKMGLIKSFFFLLGMFLGIFLSIKFAAQISEWTMRNWLSSDGLADAITWAIIILVTVIIIWYLGKYAAKLKEIGFFGPIDRLGGFAIGVLLGGIICCAAVVFLFSIGAEGHVENSEIASRALKPIASWMADNIPATTDQGWITTVKNHFAKW
ncbi:MAG: CvpA family protein [Chloroflexi bacterium]|mgnify:CR=1 FL=1|nr:CvpA family protein [Chloroflexota bacterium]MBT7080344.1 CvpA family protein [Chloroflexota bacterium]